MHQPEQIATEPPYIPARLVEGKEWYVVFYAFNPAKGRLDRRKPKLNRIKSITERRKVGRQMVININAKLEKGWNPFIEEEGSKAFHKLEDVIATYLKIGEKEFEEDTMRSYRSFCDFLKEYIATKLKDEGMYVYKFTDQTAADLMLYISTLEKIGLRTYNNYLTFYKNLFNWMVKFKYKKTNPFASLSKKKVPKTKNRKPLTLEIRHNLKEYLLNENVNFLLAMLIEYYCLLRPKELSYLQVKDIDIDNMLIWVNSEEAKNDNTSHRTITPQLLSLLQQINMGNDPEHYVFSDDKTYKFIPGTKHLDSRKFAKYWAILRDKFGFGKEFKFYSLKDTGIIDYLEDGVSIENVRDQADHSSIAVTAIYARHVKPKGSQQIRERAREF